MRSTSRKTLLAAALVAAAPAAPGPALAVSAGERLKAEAEEEFGRSAIPVAARFLPAQGPTFIFSVQQNFPDEAEVFGSGVSLSARKRPRAADEVYEVTGTLSGSRYDITNPIVLRWEESHGLRRAIIEGPDLQCVEERQDGWPEARLDASFGTAAAPELAAALEGLLDVLPALKASPIAASPAPIPGARNIHYEFQRTADPAIFYAGGPDANLRVEGRDWAGGRRFEASGAALGKQFGPGEEGLAVETDPPFLGPRGYRLRGGAMEVEARDLNGTPSRLEFRGTSAAAADFAFFALSLARYACGR